MVRIARVPRLSADLVLGMSPLPEDGEDGALRARLAAAASRLTGPPLEGAVAMVEAMLGCRPLGVQAI